MVNRKESVFNSFYILPKLWEKVYLFLLLIAIPGIFTGYIAGCARVSPKPAGTTLPDPQSLRYPPLQLNFPKVDRRQLTNGLVVYLLPDDEIPIVNIAALIQTGSIYEPFDKVGLASLTGEVMRTGGVASLPADQLDEELEFHSIHLASSIDRESGSASLSVLSKDMDKGLDFFFEVLRNPVFNQEKVEVAKQKRVEKIRRKNDSPQDIVFREFRKLLYKGDPRGNEVTIAGIEKLTREDMVWFHERYFHPENIILGVSGDFEPEEMITRLEKLTNGWQPLSEPASLPPVPADLKEKSVNYISKKIPQSIMVMGGFSVPKNHPDYYAFSILDHIVGGDGFNSYLTEEIRSNRGLAYSVGSFYTPYIDYGVFGTYCFTSSLNTQVAISLIYQILNQVKSGQISPQKLQWAKDSILNQYVFSLSSSQGLVEQLMSLEYYGLPRDYLERYQENIRKVTFEDVQRVAKTYLQPDKYILLVLGSDDDMGQHLSQFGPIKVIDIEKY